MMDLDRDFLEYTNLLIPQKETMFQIFVCSGVCVEVNIFKPSIVQHSIIYLSLASQWMYDLRKALKNVRNIKFRSRTWG